MRYFKDSELVCSCCGQSGMDNNFMQVIDRMRDQAGFPFPVTSAYRCANHPVEADKAEPGTGPHCQGKAVDIAVSRDRAFIVLELAVVAGIRRIGVSQRGNKRFIHLDMADNLPTPRLWSY